MAVILQICVFLMMTAVGIGLTVEDFRRLGERPKLVVVATASQWLLLPLVAWAVAWVVPLPPDVIAGLVLLAACPAGAVSNYYAYLARADVALSVSLTAISLVASAITLPIIVAVGFRLLLADEFRVSVPITAVVSQLGLAVLLPVVLGMVVRHRWQSKVIRHEDRIRRASEVVLLLTVAILMIGLRRMLLVNIGATVLAAAAFIVLAAGVGLATGRLLGADDRQQRALMLEFGCRNTAITMLIGMAALDRPEFTAFGLVVFLTQMPIMLGGIAVANGRDRRRRSSNGEGPEHLPLTE
jgi:BASS family bile acid:Na+ symporter